jgi:hypothetical protein
MPAIRMRCPCCGMLVWQSRLNADHAFEIVIQRGGRDGATYERAQGEGEIVYQALLAYKLARKAAQLAEEVDAPFRIEIIDDDVLQERVDAVVGEWAAEAEARADLAVAVRPTFEVMHAGGEQIEVEVVTDEHVSTRRFPSLRFWKRQKPVHIEHKVQATFEVEGQARLEVVKDE